MQNEKVWNDVFVGADEEKIASVAIGVPKVLFDASIGTLDGSTRDTGLVLTKKDILAISRYVTIGLALPTQRRQVAEYLNYGEEDNGGTGLLVSDFMTTFSTIRYHAYSWADLRGRILSTSSSLELFSGQMQGWGEDFEEICNDDASVKLIEKHNVSTYEELNALKLNWAGAFPGIGLNSNTLLDLKDCFNQIKEEINLKWEETRGIKLDLENFKSRLEGTVIPQIKLRLGFVKNNKYSAEIVQINDQVTRRAEDIARLNKEYKALVEKSLGSLASMNVFGLAMAIYLGVEAENIRAERNRLNSEQDTAVRLLGSKNQTLGSLKRVEHDLQQCEIAAVDAKHAMENLRHLWSSIDVFVTSSMTRLSRITDAMRLRALRNTFKAVVKSWVDIKDKVHVVTSVFAEADKELLNEQRSPRMAILRMIDLNAGDAYPAPDMATLQNARKQMEDEHVTLAVLSETLEYMPELSRRIKSLTGDVSKAASSLVFDADQDKLKLMMAKDDLVALDKEYKSAVGKQINPLDIADINAERKQVLNNIVEEADATQKILADHYKNISRSIDVGALRHYSNGLQVDIVNANSRKAMYDAALDRYKAEQKVIDDAVTLIQNAGIENIGKDINLTLDRLKTMKMGMPEIELVMMAVDQLKVTIEGIAKNISFVIMLRESKKLREKIAAVRVDIEAQEKIVVNAQEKIKFIEVVYAVEAQRKLMVPEFAKAVNAYGSFVSAVNKTTQSEATATDFSVINAFILFLDRVTARI
jgi:hypothetical protein